MNRIGSDHLTQLKAVEQLEAKHLLSKSLTSGVEGKKGAAIGKIFSNLGNMAVTKFHRFQNLFENGTWINNNTVMKKLEGNFTQLEKALKEGGVNKEEAITIAAGIEQMRAICTILKENGANKTKLDKLVKNLDKISLDTAIKYSETVKNERVNKSISSTHKEVEETTEEIEEPAAEEQKLQKVFDNQESEQMASTSSQGKTEKLPGEHQKQEVKHHTELAESLQEKQQSLNAALTSLLELVDEDPEVSKKLGKWIGSYSSDNSALRKFRDSGKADPTKIFEIMEKGLIETGKAQYIEKDGVNVGVTVIDKASKLAEAHTKAVEIYNEWAEIHNILSREL